MYKIDRMAWRRSLGHEKDVVATPEKKMIDSKDTLPSPSDLTI
jgi:hypothetical protein